MKLRKYNLAVCVCIVTLFVACQSNTNAQNKQTDEEQKITTATAPLQYLVKTPADTTTKAPVVILMHGYGSNEQDLFELSNAFPSNYYVFSLRAPITMQPGAYQWFHNDASGGNMTDVEMSSNKVKSFIQYISTHYKIDTKCILIGGFSQGAIMSYQLGLRNPGLAQGLIVFSGRLLPDLKSGLDWKALRNLHVFIGHGDLDDRIKYEEAVSANKYLLDNGVKTDFHTYQGMRHSINEQELQDVMSWMNALPK